MVIYDNEDQIRHFSPLLVPDGMSFIAFNFKEAELLEQW